MDKKVLYEINGERLTPWELRQRFSNVSFPEVLTQEMLTPLGVTIVEVLPPEPPVPTLAQLKEAKKNELAQTRYDAERAGMTWNNVFIKTDDVAQAKITGAALAVVENSDYQLANWKVGDGSFITLTGPVILALAKALRDFVQAQFDREATLSKQVDAAKTKQAVEAIVWLN